MTEAFGIRARGWLWGLEHRLLSPATQWGAQLLECQAWRRSALAHSQAPLEQCHRLSLQQSRKIGKRSTPGRVQFWLLFTRSKKIKPPKTKGINWKIQPSGPGLETSFIGLTFHPFQAQNPSPLLILELLVSSPRNPVHLNNSSVCSQPFHTSSTKNLFSV